MSRDVETRRAADRETGLSIYFRDPHSPWQRGSNENTNGLLRQYFPKGTDLAAHGADELAAVAHALIRRAKVTDATAHDGARLREGLIDPDNTASEVWADSAYRSAENERYLASIGKVSRIHRRKPKGKPMPKRTARANAKKSAVRARVEHPLAHLKRPMGLVIRTIGIARATAIVTLANMACNMRRCCWLDGRSLPA
jgi:IS5 family transposase